MSRRSKEAVAQPVIACSLAPAQLTGQLERWRNLYAEAGIERRVTDDGLRVSFRSRAAVEQELRALVAVEVECCSWASWSIEEHDDVVILAITSTGDGIPVIHGWLLDSTRA